MNKQIKTIIRTYKLESFRCMDDEYMTIISIYRDDIKLNERNIYNAFNDLNITMTDHDTRVTLTDNYMVFYAILK